jgi:hypothetical protein
MSAVPFAAGIGGSAANGKTADAWNILSCRAVRFLRRCRAYAPGPIQNRRFERPLAERRYGGTVPTFSYQVSTNRWPADGCACDAAAARVEAIRARVSAGSMTSSISKS